MSGVISTVEQVTPEWLTAVLSRVGALERGQVTAVQAHHYQTNMATAMPLQLAYSDDAPDSAPKKLFLKIGKRRVEAMFYRHVAPEMTGTAILTCYDSAYDGDSGTGHLLLNDVSATHFAPPDALPMPMAYCEQLADILADIHARWWEHPRLASDIRGLTEDIPAFILKTAQEGFAGFVDTLEDRLSPHRCAVYERILSTWPLSAWQERLTSARAVTLTHGDSHWWNFLYPYRRDDRIYVIDWEAWHVNVGVFDLAYMIALQCFPEQRARIEPSLARRYHQRLLERGIGGYDWTQCWHDYRAAVIYHTLWPICWQKWDLPPNIWWPCFERGMMAFEDLGCEEFLT